MKLNNKTLIILFICVISGFFGFVYEVSAAYETVGAIISTNLLPASGSEIINSFTYTITIPSGSGAYIQFSSNNIDWYDSAGTYNGMSTLSAGTNTINLSARGWHGYLFYYKIMFTSDGTVTPSLDSITMSYVNFNGDYNIYNTTGSLTSTNLLSGRPAAAINSFTYDIPSLPPNATATAQFSKDNSNWYNSAGALGGSNSLSAGTNTIDLSSLVWSGTTFYYKMSFTSDGTYSPVADSISLNYTQQMSSFILKIKQWFKIKSKIKIFGF